MLALTNSQIAVEPFHATLLLHLHAALSNIHSEIRLDALKLLDIYLRIFPNAVTSGWPYSAEASGLNSKTPGQQVLEAHLALLHIKHVGRGAALAGSSAPLSSAVSGGLSISQSLRYCTILTGPRQSSDVARGISSSRVGRFVQQSEHRLMVLRDRL